MLVVLAVRAFFTKPRLTGPTSLSLATLDAVGRIKLSDEVTRRVGAGELGTAVKVVAGAVCGKREILKLFY